MLGWAKLEALRPTVGQQLANDDRLEAIDDQVDAIVHEVVVGVVLLDLTFQRQGAFGLHDPGPVNDLAALGIGHAFIEYGVTVDAWDLLQRRDDVATLVADEGVGQGPAEDHDEAGQRHEHALRVADVAH